MFCALSQNNYQHFLFLNNIICLKQIVWETQKYFAVPGPLVSPAVSVCGWCKLTPDLDPTPIGSHSSNWSSSMQMSQILHFQTILQIGLTWPLTSWTCEGSCIESINQVWFQSDFNFSNEVNFTFWTHLTTWPQMSFDLDMRPLTSSTNEGSHDASMTQLWLKSIKAWGR